MEAHLTFVNHASYLLECGPVRLLTDPWLEGSAFNDGWDLLVETPFRAQDLASATHVWLSHEHPDHFSPGFFKAIPGPSRPGLELLYQETRDKKVVGFCRQLGYPASELRNARWHSLAPGIEILCGQLPPYDSWLATRAGGMTVLNLNDCATQVGRALDSVKESVGSVDVLLSQFSYACWSGNEEDVGLRREAARDHLRKLSRQIEVLRPKFVIPFASLIHFAHHENAYMNDEVNTIAAAREAIREAGSTPVILFPGDRWQVGEAWDDAAALKAYRTAYQARSGRRRGSRQRELAELEELGKAYLARIKQKNGAFWPALASRLPGGFLGPLDIWLSDAGAAVRFDFQGGIRRSDATASEALVSMGSDSLAFILTHDWGLDTLVVNGRFRATPQGLLRLKKAFLVGSLNNTGRLLNPSLLLQRSLVKRAVGLVLAAQRAGRKSPSSRARLPVSG